MQVQAQTIQRSPSVPAPPSALNLLEQFGSMTRVARDQEIYAEGAPAAACYRVISGCVRIVRLMEDGRRQVGDFALPGDLIGLDALETHDDTAEAVVDTVLRRYPRRMVEALADTQPALSCQLRKLALANLRSAHARMLLLGRKTANERLASFLLEMDRRSPLEAGHLALPMTRADIADYLGLTVETVCRVLAHLKREALLTMTGPGTIRLDRPRLRVLACETRH